MAASEITQPIDDALLSVAAPEPDAVAVALEAFRRLDHGAQTGEWQPFLATLHDDLTWFGPVPGFEGLHEGKASAEELFLHHSSVTRTHWELKNVVANGNEIAFEAWTKGTIEGRSYANLLLMLFVVEDDKIRHFREYAGIINGVGEFNGLPDKLDSGSTAWSYKGR